MQARRQNGSRPARTPGAKRGGPHARPTAADMGIDLKEEGGLFEWFLASFLFAKPIQAAVAQRTFAAFRRHGLRSARAIHRKSWQGLVDILGEGHYRRYDESTARYLLAWTGTLVEDCDGDLRKLAEAAGSRKAFEAHLVALKGVGPKAVEIFMREARRILYPARSRAPSEGARAAASQ